MSNRADSTSQALQAALSGDLSFTNLRSPPHPLHGIHPYAARFPHGLTSHFITKLTTPGETVLDPTCGSGTTLLEAGINGRKSIGTDIDPLAIMQSVARSRHVDPQNLWNAGQAAWTHAGQLLREQDPWKDLTNLLDDASVTFITQWFNPTARAELAAISTAVARVPDTSTRNVLTVVMSSTIISNRGVSMAEDIAHSRPHRPRSPKAGPSPMNLFYKRLRATAAAYAASPTTNPATVIRADARHLPLQEETIQLALWSPPYANALDYIRSHKFTLVWLNNPIGNISRMARDYMGIERVRSKSPQPPRSAAAQSAVRQLNAVSPRTADAISDYFTDLEQAIRETIRVLQPGSASVIIVAPSTVRGVPVQTHEAVAEALADAGMIHPAVAQRNISRNRRMMPAKSTPGAGIENRMRTEYVVAAVKPS